MDEKHLKGALRDDDKNPAVLPDDSEAGQRLIHKRC